MPKIKLLGIRDLITDDIIEAQKDYGIFLVASRVSEEKTDDEEELIYRLRVTHIDSITDLKDHKEVKFEKGKSPSQKLRFRITEKLGEEDYPVFIDYLMGRIDEITDDYLETLKS